MQSISYLKWWCFLCSYCPSGNLPLMKRTHQIYHTIRYTVFLQSRPKCLSWHRVISLKKINKQDENLAMMFNGLFYQLSHTKNHVHTAPTSPETTLRVSNRVFYHRLKSVIEYSLSITHTHTLHYTTRHYTTLHYTLACLLFCCH